MKKIHMKQYIRTLMLAVALAPVFSSCDYLDKEPDDMLTLDRKSTRLNSSHSTSSRMPSSA